MQRFDRILGILLFLRSGQSISASELARHFEVSPRTVYRDLETLSSLGVPLYAERGREGGFQLLEGYFLPPLMFSRSEAIALLLGVSLQKNLQATPFPRELIMAEQKLLAALPARLRAILEKAEQIIGVERLPHDIFHPESTPSASADASSPEVATEAAESKNINIFFQAILDGKEITLLYRSEHHTAGYEVRAEPLGLFWDRDHWYLVGRRFGAAPAVRTWRADRVLQIAPGLPFASARADFDVRDLLGRSWLRVAMQEWSQRTPVKIRLSRAQAARLQRDWYYQHAQFEPISAEQVMMTFGEWNSEIVFELLRWLGPGAELIEPRAWRDQLRAELQQMLEYYTPE